MKETERGLDGETVREGNRKDETVNRRSGEAAGKKEAEKSRRAD